VTAFPEPFGIWARSVGLRERLRRRRDNLPQRGMRRRRTPPVRRCRATGGCALSDRPDAAAEYRTLPLRRGATGAPPGLSTDPIGSAPVDEAVRWRSSGLHGIVVKDSADRTAETRITVR
jgi:hypothetical protein